MKFFNTEGPIDQQIHYYVANRANERQIQELIDQRKYFVLHAPRQSGKTTSMRASVERLNREGRYQAIYVNVEAAQIARNDVKEGMRLILEEMLLIAMHLDNSYDPLVSLIEKELLSTSGLSLKKVLDTWSRISDKPIVLYLDEIDSLMGDTLVSVLRQLRSGHMDRPHHFPQSVCLIGVRDVRDYRIWSEENQAIVIGGSAFHSKAESLTLSNFSLEQITDLYTQHTQETGQEFTDEALEYAAYLTQGQPWLVNALAYQACLLEKENTITKETIGHAKEILVLRRDTHIDLLIDKLQEPRVRTIMDIIISGNYEVSNFKLDDLQYVRDLGLVSQRGVEIANPLYQEIIPRELSYTSQESLENVIGQQPHLYKNKDGSFNIHNLLQAFTQFYRENSAIWLEKFDYKESGPHLLLMAFLQRIINGGGRIHREYALGRKRVDLLIEVPACQQRVVIELKIKHNEKTLAEGLEQTAGYMDINNATEGHLIIFDRTQAMSWNDKIYTAEHMAGKKNITVWGL